jgi:hypothetical protein
MSVLSAKRVRRLSLGLPVPNDIFQGFEPGDFAVLHGNAASCITFALSVRAQLPPEQGGLASSVVFVDGGNLFNPYLVAEIARAYGLDSRDALERIHISRAFTAYQFSSLILEKLDSTLKRHRARLLAVSDVTSLFLDRDIPKVEARELFVKACTKLSETALKEQIIVVAGYFPERRSRQGLFFEAVLFGKCNVLIRLKRIGRVLTFTLEDHPRVKSFNMDFQVDQTPLAVFFGGANYGTNCSILQASIGNRD